MKPPKDTVGQFEVVPNKLKRVAVAYPSGNATAVVFDQLVDAKPQRAQ